MILDEILTEVRKSPQDAGCVERIVCRPDNGQRRVLQQAKLDTVQGLIGDNWLVRGSRHTPDGSALIDAQITLTNSRFIEMIAGDRWLLAGDQFYVDLDLSYDNLPSGQRLKLGSAILEISAKPHTGCKKFVERFGVAVLELASTPEGKHQRLRGVNARVVQNGVVGVGEVVQKV